MGVRVRRVTRRIGWIEASAGAGKGVLERACILPGHVGLFTRTTAKFAFDTHICQLCFFHLKIFERGDPLKLERCLQHEDLVQKGA